ncbi:hypothetical protein [Blastomonas sp. SL216]|uniref:hypothetical protein n=1 Tax=Blastomonas sp. SL216 TaxID=2995169 RepID=UPI00237751C6|nr:hypothetical protein OU999_13790 [Blastomonas sp. SL216]
MPNALEKRFEAARYNTTIVRPVTPESVWERRISNHVAYALLVYTGLQIFVVMEAIRGEGASILPYLGLIALVGIVIPLCRRVERRWQGLARSGASEETLAARFRGDRLGIWLFAIGFPFGFVALVKGIAALA